MGALRVLYLLDTMVTRAWYSPRGHYVAWYLSEQHGTPLMGHYVAWYQCGIRPHIFTTCPCATGVDAPPHPTKYFSSFVFCNHFQGLLCICDSWLLNDVFCNVTRRNAMHCNGKYRICKVLKLWREAPCPVLALCPYLPPTHPVSAWHLDSNPTKYVLFGSNNMYIGHKQHDTEYDWGEATASDEKLVTKAKAFVKLQ